MNKTTDTPAAETAQAPGSEFLMCPKDGEILEFRGCTWQQPEWDFDAPKVLYSPVERYSDQGGSICEGATWDLVEEVCGDLCEHGKVPRGFSEDDLSEFEWREWSPKGFKRRKRAVHDVIRVRFFRNGEEMSYEILPQNK